MNKRVMVLDSMHVHNFHCQMVNGVKMLSDDATITAAENILLILQPHYNGSNSFLMLRE